MTEVDRLFHECCEYFLRAREAQDRGDSAERTVMRLAHLMSAMALAEAKRAGECSRR